MRSHRSSIKFYDEITKMGKVVAGKPALRAHLFPLSKDNPVKYYASKCELNLLMPKQTGNQVNTNWVTLCLS